VPVTGVVRLDGSPLVGATVIFSPLESGSAASGQTNLEGRYRLTFSEHEPGIAIGTYVVRITTASALRDAGIPTFEVVPPAYNEESSLIREVTLEQGAVDFNLRSDADAGRSARSQNRSGSGLNVILVVADSLGTEWLGCYGGQRSVTPNLDALASRGMRFTTV